MSAAMRAGRSASRIALRSTSAASTASSSAASGREPANAADDRPAARRAGRRTPGAIGHPELMLGDRDEASEVGESRELVDRRELTAEAATFDGVPDGSRQKPLGDLVADEVILGSGMERDRSVGLVAGCGEDDPRPRPASSTSVSSASSGPGSSSAHDHRVLIRPHGPSDARSGMRATSKPSPSSSVPKPLTGPHQQHADRVVPHVTPLRNGSSYPALHPPQERHVRDEGSTAHTDTLEGV